MRSGEIEHARIADIGRFLRRGDLLVVNNTRVFAARLLGRRVPSGGAVECLLLSLPAAGRDGAVECDALMHPGQKLKPGARVRFDGPAGALVAEVLEQKFFGRRRIRLSADGVGCGVRRGLDRRARAHAAAAVHQAARRRGGSRAISDDVRRRARVGRGADRRPALHAADRSGALAEQGVGLAAVTLHVGYGTFKPVRAERVEDHIVDPEAVRDRRDRGCRHQQRPRARGGA